MPTSPKRFAKKYVTRSRLAAAGGWLIASGAVGLVYAVVVAGAGSLAGGLLLGFGALLIALGAFVLLRVVTGKTDGFYALNPWVLVAGLSTLWYAGFVSLGLVALLVASDPFERSVLLEAVIVAAFVPMYDLYREAKLAGVLFPGGP